MRKLTIFETISLDGYFTGADNDSRWMHRPTDDKEFQDFIAGNASGGGELLFGRRTYDMMASWWPTPEAARQFPAVAKAMNEQPKLVVSRSLAKPEWQNTRLIKDNLIERIGELKAEAGPHIVVLGSGSIVAQLTDAGLVDEFQVVVFPIVLGSGRSLFGGVTRHVDLERMTTRAFTNGRVFSTYQPRGG